MLKTEVFPHSHNKFSIAKNIEETLKSFKLNNKNIVFVNDGDDANLYRFIVHDLLHNERFSVFSEMVNKFKKKYKILYYNVEQILKIQKVFEDEEQIKFLSDISEIYSTIDTENQYQMGEEILSRKLGSLKNSNDIRWNNLCTMFKR